MSGLFYQGLVKSATTASSVSSAVYLGAGPGLLFVTLPSTITSAVSGAVVLDVFLGIKVLFGTPFLMSIIL